MYVGILLFLFFNTLFTMKTKKGNKNVKKRRNESNTTSAMSELKDATQKYDIPFLGQSTMLSQGSTSTVSRFDNINDMMLNETIASERKSDGAFLKRKISIQELVAGDEDLTQTQQIDDEDEISMSQGGHNTIVEIDDMEESQFFENETSLLPVELTAKSNARVSLPSPRWGSTMTMIDKSKILVYGGQGVDPKTNDYVTYNDLYLYDVVNRTWKQPVNCEGEQRERDYKMRKRNEFSWQFVFLFYRRRPSDLAYMHIFTR